MQNFLDASKSIHSGSRLPSVSRGDNRSLDSDASLSSPRNYGNYVLSTDAVWRARQRMVQLACKEAWSVYEQYAFGHDELSPLSLRGRDNHGGIGLMILESLSTLKMLGLEHQYQRASLWVAQNLSVEHSAYVSVSQTMGKAVGGLLSAQDMATGDDLLFLQRAVQLSLKLLKAFSQGVLPGKKANLNGHAVPTSDMETVLLGEFGSMQMELFSISQRLGIEELADISDYPTRFLNHTYNGRGLLHTAFRQEDGAIDEGSHSGFSMGKDSLPFYEALLNMWIMTGKQADIFKSMWQKAVGQALEQLAGTFLNGQLILGRRLGGRVQAIMEYETCALPAMVALGMTQGAIDISKIWYFMQNADRIMETCSAMYTSTATGSGAGLAPGELHADEENLSHIQSNDTTHMLAPHTIKSLLYMWRVSRDNKYREMGWKIFQALLHHSKLPTGAFAAVQHVNEVPALQMDHMPNHVIGQTLKYLWLLFGEDSAYSISRGWLLNSEGHPIRY